MEVEVSIQRHFASTNCPIEDRTWVGWFSLWLEKMHPKLPPAKGYELSLLLTSDAEIQTINAQYRHQNQPTDVLAFAALEVDFPKSHDLHPLTLGDIVISVETADRQAQEQRHSLSYELAWLAAHGFLHLLGWDHPDEESRTQMLEQQDILLQTAGIVTHLIPSVMTIEMQTQNNYNQALTPNRESSWQVAENLIISFKYAWQGVRYAFYTQRNFRIHLVLGTLAMSGSLVFHLQLVEIAVIGITTGLVLVMELLNTALEAVVDLTVNKTYHELAKIAKDCAAGAVLISALVALVVAGLLLFPPLITMMVKFWLALEIQMRAT